MDRSVARNLLAAHLLAVVSASYVTKNVSAPPSSSSSSSDPPSPSSWSLSPVPTTPVPPQCPSCPSLSPPLTTPLSAPPTLAFLRLRGGADPCRGVVYLHLHLSPAQFGPVCEGSELKGLRLCPGAGCGAELRRGPSEVTSEEGFHILSDGALSKNSCQALEIHCEVAQSSSISRELAAYKVVTGLLSVTVLVMVLIRFGQKFYTTASKRLFGQRRREWIGPTESVSFRVQNTLHPNSNADKRLSYPGLERLTVNNSREPSSNRNSDYDSYN